ncbi:hypothetical protein KKG41_01625 [Patescibacteria group bacterium]|nr:hypothetical protein [Patescibacteria group bacterium]
MIKVEVKGNEMVITVPMGTPTPSASGKTLVVASSRGNQATDCIIQGKPVIVGFNAYITRG